jgi:hypothetical protein
MGGNGASIWGNRSLGRKLGQTDPVGSKKMEGGKWLNPTLPSLLIFLYKLNQIIPLSTPYQLSPIKAALIRPKPFSRSAILAA